MKVSTLGTLILSLGLATVASSEELSTAQRSSSQQVGTPSLEQSLLAPCIWNGEVRLNDSERAGCQIWFFATAGNARFHAYVFQQRLGVLIDWYDVLNAKYRERRFKRWGLIYDPDCRPPKPGEKTYGFDWCPGDDELLKFVGKTGYKDPACDFKDAELSLDEKKKRVHPQDQWQDPCDLEFGTSTGVLGFRKFPNPRFNEEQWRQLNERAWERVSENLKKLNKPDPGPWDGSSWVGFSLPSEYKMPPEAATTKTRAEHKKILDAICRTGDKRVECPPNPLLDGSIEPPFLIGVTCGSCHIAFDPLHPPSNPAKPEWKNISGTVGNQYVRDSQIFASGMPLDSLERQVFTRARPGTMDTSGIPTDQLFNPGTINALINLSKRVENNLFKEEVEKWRASNQQCPAGADERTCWCEPGTPNKCWVKSTKPDENVLHILKGGEDSIGDVEPLQRVYINIGSCSESAWVNHLTDLRRLHPPQRNFGQTPVDIGQLRRDCPNFRAIEDRRYDILNFLLTGRPTDLRAARENELRMKTGNSNAPYTQAQLEEDLEKKFKIEKGAIALGRRIFAVRCAKCHSSLPENEENGKFTNRTFLETDKDGLRKDWLGNDQLTPVQALDPTVPPASDVVETNTFRALHSNHMAGHVWEEFASNTYRNRPRVNLTVPSDGGRGYYRNISLLSVWAHAPFMHNNAIGPELCSGPDDEFYDPPYVKSLDNPLELRRVENPPPCWTFDPSVEGRLKLFKKSMDQLLNPEPEKRGHKVTRLITDALLPGPMGIAIRFPEGKASALISNFRHKDFADDLRHLLSRDPVRVTKLKEKFAARYGRNGDAYFQQLLDLVGKIEAKRKADPNIDPTKLLMAVHDLRFYLNSQDLAELNEAKGHNFGTTDLSDPKKRALAAFLATL